MVSWPTVWSPLSAELVSTAAEKQPAHRMHAQRSDGIGIHRAAQPLLCIPVFTLHGRPALLSRRGLAFAEVKLTFQSKISETSNIDY